MVGTTDMAVAFFILNQPTDDGGIESADHHLPETHHGGRLGASPPVGVEERNSVQFDIVVVVIERAGDSHGVHIDGAVREHHAFGRPRAAARIEEFGDGILVEGEDVGSFGLARREKIFVFGIEISWSAFRARLCAGIPP